MEKILILGIRLVILCIKSFALYLLWNYLLVELISCLNCISYWQSLSSLFLVYCLLMKVKININGKSKSSQTL